MGKQVLFLYAQGRMDADAKGDAVHDTDSRYDNIERWEDTLGRFDKKETWQNRGMAMKIVTGALYAFKGAFTSDDRRVALNELMKKRKIKRANADKAVTATRAVLNNVGGKIMQGLNTATKAFHIVKGVSDAGDKRPKWEAMMDRFGARETYDNSGPAAKFVMRGGFKLLRGLEVAVKVVFFPITLVVKLTLNTIDFVQNIRDMVDAMSGVRNHLHASGAEKAILPAKDNAPERASAVLQSHGLQIVRSMSAVDRSSLSADSDAERRPIVSTAKTAEQATSTAGIKQVGVPVLLSKATDRSVAGTSLAKDTHVDLLRAQKSSDNTRYGR